MANDPIDDFIQRVKRMNKSSRELRLSYDEANALAVGLAELLYRGETKAVKGVDNTPPTPQIISGGTFPKRSDP